MSLTARELSLLQEEATVWQPERANVYRATSSDDGFGGSGDTTPDDLVLSNVPVRVETGAGHVQMVVGFGFERPMETTILYFPATTDVRVGDHVTITTKGNAHVRITAVMEPETEEVERMAIGTSLTGD